MQKSLQVWKFINTNLSQNILVMLLYVLESKGSSPGRQGFFMAVNESGDPSTSLRMEGSIGGGIMEHKFVELAKEKLRAKSQDPIAIGSEVKRQIHDKSAADNQSGMICSGEQTIFLYPVQQNDSAVIQKIIHSIESNSNGTLHLSPKGIAFEEAIPEKNFDFSFQSEIDWYYKEKTGYKNKLFIIGGGHCSLALSKLMQTMDFYITVFDERKDLKTMLENKSAHESILVSNYSELNELIPEGNNHYVVIMTFGYRTDDIALKALINKKFNYIGVLGSKKKMEKLFDDYRSKGINESLLNHIHSPIGLDIKSQTPEEIAVSIAAEIIKVKNGVAKKSH